MKLEFVIGENVTMEATRTVNRRYDTLKLNSGPGMLLIHNTLDSLGYHVVKIDERDIGSDDVNALLKKVFLDVKAQLEESEIASFDISIFTLMGAIKEELLDSKLKERGEFVPIADGYVIPGTIDGFRTCYECSEYEY